MSEGGEPPPSPSTPTLAGARLCRSTWALRVALRRPPHIPGSPSLARSSRVTGQTRGSSSFGITLERRSPPWPGGRLELSVRPQFEGAHTGAPRGLTHVGDVNSLRHVKPAPWRAPSGDQPNGASVAGLPIFFSLEFKRFNGVARYRTHRSPCTTQGHRYCRKSSVSVSQHTVACANVSVEYIISDNWASLRSAG